MFLLQGGKYHDGVAEEIEEPAIDGISNERPSTSLGMRWNFALH
jgi:hypothetical protein